jgi:hypothetical protein
LSSRTTGGFSRRTHFHGVSKLDDQATLPIKRPERTLVLAQVEAEKALQPAPRTIYVVLSSSPAWTLDQIVTYSSHLWGFPIWNPPLRGEGLSSILIGAKRAARSRFDTVHGPAHAYGCPLQLIDVIFAVIFYTL